MAESKPTTLRPFVFGANHRTSALALRDRLFVEDAQVAGFLETLGRAGVGQAMMLSTCDRVEVQALHEDPTAAARLVAEAMAGHAGVEVSELDGQTYLFVDDAALRHIFMVAASLDSLVVGEPQVLGQVKACHRLARDAGMTGNGLEALLQAAYTTAKRVRGETAIGERPVSIAAAAARLAQDLHGALDRAQALLVGTGEMGELVAEALVREGLRELTVAHPTESRAEALARQLDCHVADFDELARLLDEADIVLTALGSRRHVITSDMMLVALHRRRKRPVFLVDTSVPGDVEPAVNRIDEAFLYDLADLERVVMEGRASREQEAAEAARIVEEEIQAFLRDRAERAAVPALSELRTRFEDMRDQVLAEAGGDAEKATRLLVNRLLHGPSEVLRDEAAAGIRAAEDVIRRLFGLSGGGGPAAGDGEEKDQ
ncbi:MAG: glutamyl-tRNA reductase [Rhodospirillales bacterium]